MKSYIITIRKNDSSNCIKKFHVSAVDVSEAIVSALSDITNLWEIIALEVLE